MSVENNEAQEQSQNDFSQKLQNEFFGETPAIVNNEQQEQQNQNEAPAVIEKKEEEQEEILEPKDWLKREFDTDDVSVLKAEREELKTLREKNREKEFANEDSRKAYEYLLDGKEDDLYNLLSNKKKVDKLITADVTDKKVAEELVKFGLQKDNPNLTEDDVDFIFNKKYSIPERPKQGELEEEAEYNERISSWESQVKNIERELVIDAKMNQPKLAQLKNQLILPDIKREIPNQNQPTQEDLEAAKKERDNFLQFADKVVDTFNGFSVQVKDKDVDYEVPYALSTEEKKSVSDKVKQFTESGFDANGLFDDRWVNPDGKSLNVEQMVKDLSMIYGAERITQKLAHDSANKRIEQYLKERKQININNESPEPRPIVDEKSKSEKMQELFWS